MTPLVLAIIAGLYLSLIFLFRKFQKNTAKALANVSEQIRTESRTMENIRKGIAGDVRAAYRQTEALIGLYEDIQPGRSLPKMRDFAASPDFLALILARIAETRPERIIEFGSGTSTVIAAYALKKNGKGKIISLDQSETYAERTRRELAERGLEGFAEVIYAPLVKKSLAGSDRIWYDLSGIELPEADLAIIDGPFAADSQQELIRYPALPALRNSLSKRAVVMADDASRESESAVIASWQKEFPDLKYEFIPTEKGAGIFTRRGASEPLLTPDASSAEPLSVFRSEPPRFPEPLPGTFWGITTFFNPARYSVKLANYRVFRDESRKQGLKLLAVELAFGDDAFELSSGDADILIQIRGEKANTLWQKEAMLNIGLKNLPEDCDKFAWLDCDIIFKNERWVAETSALLEEYRIVQPFSHMVRLPQGAVPSAFDTERAPFGNADGQKMHGMAYGVAHFGRESLGSFMEHGHSGFAWAARKKLFDGIGLYDRSILGSGDLLIAHSFYGSDHYYLRTRFSPAMIRHQDIWNAKMRDAVGGSVCYAEGTILHLWHGTQKNRFYNERHTLLQENEFNPAEDIRLNEKGYLEWAGSKKRLESGVEDYFFMRNEDGLMLGGALRDFRGAKSLAAKLTKRTRLATSLAFKRIAFRDMIDRTIGRAGLLLRKISPKAYEALRPKK